MVLNRIIFVILILFLSNSLFSFSDETPAASEESDVGKGDEKLSVDKESISEKLTPEQKEQLSSTTESFSFQAEVNRLMDIIINSLYTQKSIFLRELISNAADALEKARFISLSEPDYLKEKPELEVLVQLNKDDKTITIQDTGVGMTREELIHNLGTVARSGTTNFLEAMAETGDLNLIGQFGVGFYSAFLVADRVTVTSKNNKEPDQHIWESMIGGTFTVGKDPRGNTLKRGTKITLHLKDDSTEFLSESLVKDVIRKFNQFISFPIKLREPKTPSKESDKKKDEDTTTDEKQEPTTYEWVIINVEKPLWMRPKENVTDEEYNEFYKSLARDIDPLAYTHFSAEGDIEFKALLYIPSHAPYDAYSAYFNPKQEAIRLYSRRVLVADSVYELMPKWLGFIKGVVDSDDLPLKVDRESFSQSKVIGVIRKKIVAKFLELIKKLSTEDREKLSAYMQAKKDETTDKKTSKRTPMPETKFKQLWNHFSKNLKMGCLEDHQNQQKIAKLLRFQSTYSPDTGFTTTLDEYIERMPEQQKDIYYVSAETYDAGLNSPHMQLFKKKNIEVLILTEPLDEPCLERLRAYEGKKIKSIEKSSVSVHDEIDKSYETKVKKAYEPLTKFWTEHLSSRIKSVRVTYRLIEDPAVITIDEGGISAYSDRISRAQMFGVNQNQAYGWLSRHLEINPNHPLIKKMKTLYETNPSDPKVKETATLIFDTALYGGGFIADDATKVSRKLFKLIQKDAGIQETEPVTEYKLAPDEEKYTPKETKTKSPEEETELPLENEGSQFANFENLKSMNIEELMKREKQYEKDKREQEEEEEEEDSEQSEQQNVKNKPNKNSVDPLQYDKNVESPIKDEL